MLIGCKKYLTFEKNIWEKPVCNDKKILLAKKILQNPNFYKCGHEFPEWQPLKVYVHHNKNHIFFWNVIKKTKNN